MQLRGSHLSKREVQSVKLCSFVELIPVKVLALIGGQVVRGAQLAKVSVGSGNVESVETEHGVFSHEESPTDVIDGA